MLNCYSEYKNMRNESKSIYRSNGLLHYNMKLLKEMKKFNQRFDKVEIDLEALISK
jgi:predicted nuclease with TOPRIM domain